VNDRKILKDFIDTQVAEIHAKKLTAMHQRDAAAAAKAPVLV